MANINVEFLLCGHVLRASGKSGKTKRITKHKYLQTRLKCTRDKTRKPPKMKVLTPNSEKLHLQFMSTYTWNVKKVTHDIINEKRFITSHAFHNVDHE